MKAILTGLVAAGLVFALAGCGNEEAKYRFNRFDQCRIDSGNR